MKKAADRLLSLFLVLVLGLGFLPVRAEAVVTRTWDEVTSIVESYYNAVTANGTKNVYWNANIRSGGTKTLKSQVDAGNYTSAVTTKSCGLTKATHTHANGCTSNLFAGVGSVNNSGVINASAADAQCSGFAAYMEYVIFRSTSLSDFTVYGGSKSLPSSYTVKPGDQVRYSGHSYVIYKVSGDTAYIIEANNPSGSCKINKGTKSVKTIKGYSYNGSTSFYISSPAVQDTSYLDKCTTYISHVDLTVNNKTTMKTLPCSASTDSASKDVFTLSVGSKLVGTQLVKNSAGNYWYKASYTSGGTTYSGYVYAGDFTATPKYDVTVSSVTAPTGTRTVGEALTLKGKITSTTLPLVKVGAFVYSGTATSGTAATGAWVSTTAKTFEIKGSDVDNKCKIGSLAKGAYTYTIKAQVTNNWTTSGNAMSTETKTLLLHSNAFSEGLATYTISYNANGGTGAPGSQTKIQGTALALSSTKPTHASASATAFTVTLNANGGSVSPTSLSASRTTAYTFKNWNTKADGSGTAYNAGASYTANAAATLYAQWNSSTSTAAVTLPTPTRSGYTFKGWATSSSAASGVTGSYTPTGNVTLYAAWQEIPKYYLDLNGYLDNADSGYIGKYGTVDVYINGKLDASGVNDYNKAWPTGTTYEFKNVIVNSGYNYDGVKSGNLTGTITGKTVVVLAFSTKPAATHTVSYNANGGTGAPGNQIKTHGTDLTLSSTKPTRADTAATAFTVTLNANGGSVSSTSLSASRTTSYTFKNWNTKADGSGTAYNAGAKYTANAAATLYAQWNSSTSTADVTLPTPTRDGYTFLGWGTSASASSGVTGSYTPTGNVTLYATWQQGASPAQTYTVKCVVTNGSAAVSASRAAKGDVISVTDIAPADGCVLESITYQAEGGSAVDITTARSFVMPAANVTVTVRFKQNAVEPPQDLFEDVTDPSAYFYDAVYWAKDKGITTGKTATTFDPYSPCTRGQIVTFIWRMLGQPAPASYANPFSDVKESDYFFTAVLWAYHGGITTGKTATSFGAYLPCTREQCVTFLWRASGRPGIAVGSRFTDVQAGAYYAEPVYWALNNGITTGQTATTFGVDKPCTRGQIVTFLYRYSALG